MVMLNVEGFFNNQCLKLKAAWCKNFENSYGTAKTENLGAVGPSHASCMA